jgi:hypothetical protein
MVMGARKHWTKPAFSGKTYKINSAAIFALIMRLFQARFVVVNQS